MIEMCLADVARAMSVHGGDSSGDLRVRRVVIDSREVVPGDLFIAIRGERFDGHDFVGQAFGRGAVACVVDDRAVASGSGDGMGNGAFDDGARLVVADTVQALGAIATHYRRHVIPASTTVVAITGSNGKTTTKAMLHHVLSGSVPGRASVRSFNNQIGVPLTLLSAEAEDRYLIAEIGSNAAGEVATLAEMVAPDVAAITSVGEAHLQGLGSVAAIVKEKASLLAFVRSGGLGVVNIDEPELSRRVRVPDGVSLTTVGTDPGADVVARAVESSLAEIVVEVDGRDRFTLPLPGAFHATNVAIVLTIAQRFGLTADVVAERLRSFAAQSGRAHVVQIEGMTVIDDAYNANPSSMRAAIDALAAERSRRRVMVMGDMFELGDRSDELHAAMIDRVRAAEIEVLVLVGDSFARAGAVRGGRRDEPCPICFGDAIEASEALGGILRRGDCVWVKGSRAVGLERVVASLRHPAQADVVVA